MAKLFANRIHHKYLTLATVLLLLCASCSQSDSTTSKGKKDNADKLQVVTTFTVIADMAANVAGDAAIVVSVTKAGAEIHNYQPTPQDIARTSGADLILWNGLGLELWFEKFLQQLDGVKSSVVTDGIEPNPSILIRDLTPENPIHTPG